MKEKSFRFCMLVGAVALLAIAIFYFATYVIRLNVALANNNFEPFLADSIRALWLCFASQALLIGLLYLLVAYKPQAVTREVIVLLGLIQLVEAGLLFALTGSMWLSLLLMLASAFVLVGAMLWPPKLAAEELPVEPAPDELEARPLAELPAPEEPEGLERS